MKVLRNLAIAGAATALALSAAPAPAMAASTLITYCSKGNYHAQFTLRYDTTGGNHYFRQLSWRISGDVGTRNAVQFTFVREGSSDQVIAVYSRKGARNGRIDISLKRPQHHRIHVRSAVVFDTKATTDPGCAIRTRPI